MKSNYDIIWSECVDSTNEEAKRRLSSLDNLSVLSVLSQTKGRGHEGNVWLSEPGANLLFSIVLKFEGEDIRDSQRRLLLSPVQAYDQFVISQIASLSVVDLLAAHEIQARIKWPNDIYVGDKKICGILIENTVKGKWLSSSIIGIGLNVNQRNFDVNLPNPTSMSLCSEEVQPPFDLKDLLEEFMDVFTGYLDRFCHITGGYNRLGRLYHAQLWRLDQPADFIDMTAGFIDQTDGFIDQADGFIDQTDGFIDQATGAHNDLPSGTTNLPARTICHRSPLSPAGTPFRGIIRGTSPVGHLLVELPDGSTREFSFKEIAYIL